jgi:acetyltransferase-like isoleucine patch superfamily enzyme
MNVVNEKIKFVAHGLRGNFLKTMLLALRKKTLCTTVFPDVTISVAPSSDISGVGRLFLGRKWEGLRYLPSEFKIVSNAKLIVEGRFSVYTGFHIAVNEGATLRFGSGYINNNSTIDCFESITIGYDVAISNGVTIRDSDNHSFNGNKLLSSPIFIGDHVWIGLNVTILKGVCIGNGAVIAAGAVVIDDVPENSLVGGIPARVIRENISWE